MTVSDSTRCYARTTGIHVDQALASDAAAVRAAAEGHPAQQWRVLVWEMDAMVAGQLPGHEDSGRMAWRGADLRGLAGRARQPFGLATFGEAHRLALALRALTGQRVALIHGRPQAVELV